MISLVGIATLRQYFFIRFLLKRRWNPYLVSKSILKLWQLLSRDRPRLRLVHDKTLAKPTSVDCLLSGFKAGICSWSDRFRLECNVIHNVWGVLEFRRVELKEVKGGWKVVNNHLMHHLFNTEWTSWAVLPYKWAGHSVHKIPQS